MTSLILVTGGTGNLGRHLVPMLSATGARLRVLSRHPREPAEGIEHVRGDLLKNDGVEAAVTGADVIVHLAGGPKGDDEATRNLVRAARRIGVRHLVYISVIGADRVPLGYFRSKLGAERIIADSGLPWTTLRAAQFHDLVLTAVQAMSRLPVVPAPGGLRFQPVDVGEVADRMALLAAGEPAGLVRDLAGPETHSLADLARSYLRARRSRRPFLPVRIPGKAGRAYRAGENLNLDDADRGARTWEEFLSEKLG